MFGSKPLNDVILLGVTKQKTVLRYLACMSRQSEKLREIQKVSMITGQLQWSGIPPSSMISIDTVTRNSVRRASQDDVMLSTSLVISIIAIYSVAETPTGTVAAMEMFDSVIGIFCNSERSQHLHRAQFGRENRSIVPESLEISGCSKNEVNGAYDPTGDVFNGAVVYAKRRAEEIVIAYNIHELSWQICSKHMTGTSRCYARLTSAISEPVHVCKTVWQVGETSPTGEHLFREQISTKMKVSSIDKQNRI